MTVAVRRTWAETSVVAPGEALVIDLILSPLRAFAGGRHTFTVVSRMKDLPGTEPVVAEGSLEMAGKSWLRRLGPSLVVLLAAATLLALAWWFILRV